MLCALPSANSRNTRRLFSFFNPSFLFSLPTFLWFSLLLFSFLLVFPHLLYTRCCIFPFGFNSFIPGLFFNIHLMHPYHSLCNLQVRLFKFSHRVFPYSVTFRRAQVNSIDSIPVAFEQNLKVFPREKLLRLSTFVLTKIWLIMSDLEIE